VTKAKSTRASGERKRKAGREEASPNPPVAQSAAPVIAPPGPIRPPPKPADFAALEAKALEGASGTPAPAVPPNTLPTNDNVPLAKGGPIALLMVANLDDEEGFKSLVRALQGTQPRDDADRATVEQLKLAQEFGRLLSVAVTEGRDSPLWKRMEDALNLLRGVQMARRAVVEILADLVHYKRRTDEFQASHPDYVSHPEMAPDSQIAQALRALKSVDQAFAKVTGAKLKELLDRPRLGAVGIAVELSIAHGVFGDKLKDSETGKKPAQQKRRIRGLYDEALRVGRTKSQSTT